MFKRFVRKLTNNEKVKTGVAVGIYAAYTGTLYHTYQAHLTEQKRSRDEYNQKLWQLGNEVFAAGHDWQSTEEKDAAHRTAMIPFLSHKKQETDKELERVNANNRYLGFMNGITALDNFSTPMSKDRSEADLRRASKCIEEDINHTKSLLNR